MKQPEIKPEKIKHDSIWLRIMDILFKVAQGLAIFSGFFLGALIFRKHFPPELFKYLIKYFAITYAFIIPLSMITAAWIAWFQFRNRNRMPENSSSNNEEGQSRSDQLDLLQVDFIGLELGYELLYLVDNSQTRNLLEVISNIRNQFALELGIMLPPVRIRDNMQLKPNEYQLKIKNNVLAFGTINPNSCLVMDPKKEKPGFLKGIETREPVFGLPAMWIQEDEKKKAEDMGYTVVDELAVLATHLKDVIKKNGFELLSRAEVKKRIEKLSEQQPGIIEGVIPEKISLTKVHIILKNLLKEEISVRDLSTTLEIIGEWAEKTDDTELLTEYVRIGLKNHISNKFATAEKILHCLKLDLGVQQELLKSKDQNEFGSNLNLDPKYKLELIQNLQRELNNLSNQNIAPVILTSFALRKPFKNTIEKSIPQVPVLSELEVSEFVKVKTVGVLKQSENSN